METLYSVTTDSEGRIFVRDEYTQKDVASMYVSDDCPNEIVADFVSKTLYDEIRYSEGV